MRTLHEYIIEIMTWGRATLRSNVGFRSNIHAFGNAELAFQWKLPKLLANECKCAILYFALVLTRATVHFYWDIRINRQEYLTMHTYLLKFSLQQRHRYSCLILIFFFNYSTYLNLSTNHLDIVSRRNWYSTLTEMIWCDVRFIVLPLRRSLNVRKKAQDI